MTKYQLLIITAMFIFLGMPNATAEQWEEWLPSSNTYKQQEREPVRPSTPPQPRQEEVAFEPQPSSYSYNSFNQNVSYQEESSDNYRIGVGDLLQIDVYDEEDLSKEVRVLTDGKISLPLLGTVSAASKTVKGLEREVTRLLGAKYLVNPQVTVFVKEFSNVYVTGEVENPGSFPLTGKMTVFESITLAGGFTEVANPSKVKIIRKEGGRQVVFEVDLEKLTKHGDPSEDKELRANDRVIVQRSFF